MVCVYKYGFFHLKNKDLGEKNISFTLCSFTFSQVLTFLEKKKLKLFLFFHRHIDIFVAE